MSDWFYKSAKIVLRFPFWVSSSPIVLHADRARRAGAFIIAANHLSPFDAPVLIRSTPRDLDFVSTTDVFAKAFAGWFLGKMNAFPLDRARVDSRTVKVIIDRLSRGRVVAMFPEGRIRGEDDSVVHGAPFAAGVARLARMAGVAIIPVVLIGTGNYGTFVSWLPLKRTRYAVIYGEPIEVHDEAIGEKELARAYRELYAELQREMGLARD